MIKSRRIQWTARMEEIIAYAVFVGEPEGKTTR
jgi:hypothetical protein